jgi:aminomethyltransferase
MEMLSKKTPLYNDHLHLSATMVDFAGYLMPVRYKEGIIEEHLWVRNNCGIFDVSHMGQIMFTGENITSIFSKLTPTDFSKIKDGTCKYTVLLNENGGIFDDLIVTKFSHNEFYVVWNASRKHENIKHLLSHFPNAVHKVMSNRALVAIQGPKTFDVLHAIFPQIAGLGYMKGMRFSCHKYGEVIVTRTGYTGEKGVEVSVDGLHAHALWKELMHNDFVRPIGLGARDSLRLEVGYPLYGNDLDLNTDPISAGVSFVMTKAHDDYLGVKKIQEVMENGAQKKRVGIILQDRGVLRHGYKVFYNGSEVSDLSSGGYSPVLEKSIGMAYLPANIKVGDKVHIEIRGKMLDALVADFPFLTTDPR